MSLHCRCLDAATYVKKKQYLVFLRTSELNLNAAPLQNDWCIYTKSCHTGKEVSRPEGRSVRGFVIPLGARDHMIKTAAVSLSALCFLATRCY